MDIFVVTEECPGCGLFFVPPAELSTVDFSGEKFQPEKPEE